MEQLQFCTRAPAARLLEEAAAARAEIPCDIEGVEVHVTRHFATDKHLGSGHATHHAAGLPRAACAAGGIIHENSPPHAIHPIHVPPALCDGDHAIKHNGQVAVVVT